MKYTNIPSQKTAMKNGMVFIEQYPDLDNGITCVYGITNTQWKRSKEMLP